jgi:hypothetical protein
MCWRLNLPLVRRVGATTFENEYVSLHPWFYFGSEIKAQFKDTANLPDSSICRAPRFNLSLTRKVLTKRARESVLQERQEYKARLGLLLRPRSTRLH